MKIYAKIPMFVLRVALKDTDVDKPTLSNSRSIKPDTIRVKESRSSGPKSSDLVLAIVISKMSLNKSKISVRIWTRMSDTSPVSSMDDLSDIINDVRAIATSIEHLLEVQE